MGNIATTGASAVLVCLLIFGAASAALADDPSESGSEQGTGPDDERGSGSGSSEGSRGNDRDDRGEGRGQADGNRTEDDADGGEDTGDGEPEDGDERNDEDEDEDDDERGARPDEPRREGRLRQNGNGTVDGRYVDFTVDFGACEIRDYSLYGVHFFDRIALSGPECGWDNSSGNEHGNQVELKAGKTKIRLHDNPTGAIRFKADEGWAVTFDVASGVTVNQTEADRVDLSVGNLTARLFLTGGEREDDDEDDDESGDGEGNETDGAEEPPRLGIAGDVVTATGASGNFLAHPMEGNSPERRAILDAMKEGDVGGEIGVLVGDNGSVTTEVLALEDVIIKVQKKSDSAFRFLVDANLTSGRVFVVNFAPGAFNAERVGVRFWDVDNDSFPSEVAITKADDLQDVLNVESGEGPEFWVVQDEKGRQVMVAVPHFSVHLFEVQSLPLAVVVLSSAPSVVVGAILGIGFSAVAAVTMMAGRKR